MVSGWQAACSGRQAEENQANVAAVDVNVKETHENDKWRKYHIVMQIYMNWFSTNMKTIINTISIGGGAENRLQNWTQLRMLNILA